MKICNHCNSQMEDNASFCPYCGQKQEAVESSVSDKTEESENAFYVFRRNLRHERKCWSIFGRVWLGFSIFFAAFSFLYLLLGIVAEPAIAAFSFVFFLYAILFLPIAIINLVMSGKITGYLNQLETNPAPAVERCGGVWLIVMGALFNTIAMIFIILNFVHVKTHRELLTK